ncbi:MAG: hypothetical protein H7145_19030 [Akkermansiaceae bacterium]|nr:hypothetical protein [Armatimonadota bacterium]
MNTNNALRYPIHLLAFAATLLATAWATPAAAEMVTFASFTAPTTESFRFVNNGSATSGFSLSNSPANVTFNFSQGQPNGYGPSNTPIASRLSFSALVSGFGFEGSGVTIQTLQNISISFIAVNPVDGKTNLLSVSGATGRVLGITGGGTFSLSVDTGLGDTLNYSSDFLLFPNSAERELTIGFTGSQPSFRLAGASGSSYLRSLSAGGNGNFAADPRPNSTIVPETTSAVLMASGSMLLGLALLRRLKYSVAH